MGEYTPYFIKRIVGRGMIDPRCSRIAFINSNALCISPRPNKGNKLFDCSPQNCPYLKEARKERRA